MGFTKNDSGQRDITDKTKILTKRGSDTIHDVIPKKIRNKPLTQHLNMQMIWLK